MKIIEEELGSPAENFFSYISPEPVAAASFGQVPPAILYVAMLGYENSSKMWLVYSLLSYSFA